MTAINQSINQYEPSFGKEEADALHDYIMQGGWITEFRKTAELEKRLAEFINAEYCIMVNNGTISLSLLAMAAGISAGDEVLVPNYTMIATPNSLRLFGAKPVFVDVEPETLCMDIQKAETALTERTKGIMLVTANGRYPKAGIDRFVDFSIKHNLVLLEDAAQSLGSFFPDGRHMGTVGAGGSFSFSMPKVISTGQGGCIVTNNNKLAERIRKMKDFGRDKGGLDIHDQLGWNFKFTDIQAVVGLCQMDKLQERLIRKKVFTEGSKIL